MTTPITNANQIDSTKTYEVKQGTVTPDGVVQYNPKTGEKLTTGQSVSVNSSGNVYGATPIMQDTTAQRTKDNQNISEFDKKVTEITGTNPGANNVNNNNIGASVNTSNTDITGADGNIYKTTAPSGYDYQLPTLTDGKKWVYGADGRAMMQDATGNIVNDPTADTQFNKNQTAIKEIADYNAKLDSFKTGLDASHQALIDRIKESSAVQKKQMEELNKMTLGTKRVQGFRTGGSEYTPEIYTGILKKEQEEGIARIGEIDANMNLLIAEAVSAKNAKDFEMFEKKFNTVRELQKAKEEAVQGVYKTYLDEQKLISDKLKEQEALKKENKDQALQELQVSVPSLTKQYDALKTDADRTNWLNIVSERTGLDVDILKGSMESSRLETESARLDIANQKSLLNKRDNPTGNGKGTGGYTATELKKLRAYGIDPSDTGKADALLYKNTKPEDYKKSGIQPEDIDITFVNKDLNNTSVENIKAIRSDAQLLEKINIALEEGYTIKDIGDKLKLDKATIRILEEAQKKSKKNTDETSIL